MSGRKLGRGLEFLLSQSKQAKTEEKEAVEQSGDTVSSDIKPGGQDSRTSPDGLVFLEVERIHPNPHQPRKDFVAEEIESLAQSIQASGILQPLLVRKKGKRFELIAGERRLRAARKAGLSQVPVVIRSVGEAELRLLALVENVQRQDLNPMEKASSFRELRDQTGWTQEKLAKELGIKRSTVANFLRLNDLPRSIQNMLREDNLSTGHAKALLQASKEQQEDLAKLAIEKDLSVRALEQLCAQNPGRPEGSAGDPAHKNIAKAKTTKAAWAREMEDHLLSALGCRSTVRYRGGRGRIILDLGNRKEFDRVFELLMNCLPHESEETLVAKKRSS